MADAMERFIDPATGQPFEVSADEVREWEARFGKSLKEVNVDEAVRQISPKDRIVSNRDTQHKISNAQKARNERRQAEYRKAAEQLQNKEASQQKIGASQRTSDHQISAAQIEANSRVLAWARAAAQQSQETKRSQQKADQQKKFEHQKAQQLNLESQKARFLAQQADMKSIAKKRESEKKASEAADVEKQHQAAEARARTETKRKETDAANQNRREFAASSRGTPEAIEKQNQLSRKKQAAAKNQKKRIVLGEKQRQANQSQAREPSHYNRPRPDLPHEQRRGDAEQQFNKASEAKPEVDIAPLGSQQVANDRPYPVLRPDWGAEVDRQAHLSAKSSDAQRAAGYNAYLEQAVAEAKSNGSETGMAASAGASMGQGFGNAAGTSEGMGMGD